MTEVLLPSFGPASSSTSTERIGLSVAGRLDVLLIEAIDWLESEGNYVRVHAGGVTSVARTTLAALWQRLGTQTFRRVHRRIVVNVARVAAVRPAGNGDAVLVLTSGEELRMSRRYRNELLSLLR